MMAVGYSGKPLIAKLGLKEGFRARIVTRIVNAPDDSGRC